MRSSLPLSVSLLRLVRLHALGRDRFLRILIGKASILILPASPQNSRLTDRECGQFFRCTFMGSAPIWTQLPNWPRNSTLPLSRTQRRRSARLGRIRRPDTSCGRSSSSPARAASARGRRWSMPRTPTATSSTCFATRARDLCLSDDRGEPRRRLPAGRACSSSRHRDLHRLRFERTHRPARGAPRARGDRTTPDRHTGRHRRRLAAPIGSVAGADGLGLESWPDAVVDLDHPQLRGAEEGRLRCFDLRLHRRRAAEHVRPVARPDQVSLLRRSPVESPRAVIREVAIAPRRGVGAAGSIWVPSCHSLYDVIVTRSARPRSPHATSRRTSLRADGT